MLTGVGNASSMIRYRCPTATFVTLHDPASYITALPKKGMVDLGLTDHVRPYWRQASLNRPTPLIRAISPFPSQLSRAAGNPGRKRNKCPEQCVVIWPRQPLSKSVSCLPSSR